MLIGLATGEEGEGGGEGEQESHSKVGTLLGPTIIATVSLSALMRFLLHCVSRRDSPHQFT